MANLMVKLHGKGEGAKVGFTCTVCETTGKQNKQPLKFWPDKAPIQECAKLCVAVLRCLLQLLVLCCPLRSLWKRDTRVW